ncbi:unnamed protein product [Brassica napus]|uniref:(rape) hypothetical protein n=1 Tax=Brassica napus TaxID=3708 RepID=A0A816NVI7_BRANA|nr:unnamed protein product [Brassica napus]
MEEDSSQVVSITGMGGIGKTTLARQVFNHEKIKSHFSRLAWVCVSQKLTRKYVWQTILRKLMPGHREAEMTEDELQEKINQFLETQKALIVLDDIWTQEDWNIIKPMFPRKRGWKVLLTSRNEAVTTGILQKDLTCFKVDCLTPQESWTLFRRIAFPKENTTDVNVDVEMEEAGKEIIKHCGGLPLALKVLGGSYEIHIAYAELPIYLKHCFLYLAHFPEDYEINVEILSYYWAAEGIPRPRYYNGASIRDVADGFIEELVERNMVISERDKTSRFTTCRLHDMLREVCLRSGEEENFLQIVDASTAASNENSNSRRLIVHSSDNTCHLDGYLQNPSLRSLLFIQKISSLNWTASGLSFRRLQLMRVLDLSRAEFKGGKLPSSIGKLIHLRYLSLYMAKVSYLPSSMRNLKLLLYLNLCVGATSPVYMPNILKEMQKLSYLFLPDNMQDKTKLELGNLINLETLENFSTKHTSVDDLQRMTELNTLSILFHCDGCTVETLSTYLGYQHI